jgi:hypothetical protein
MRRSSLTRPLLLSLVLGEALALSAPPVRAADDPSAALPELRAFLQDVRERLHSDEFLLDQYTFMEKVTERDLDGKGSVKKVTTALYEVYPSAEPGETYRRLVERDGRRLSPDELAQGDRKQEAKEARKKAVFSDGAKRLASRAQARLKEAETIEELFRIYDIRIEGRTMLDGRSTIALTFQPRPGLEAGTKAGKIVKKFAGRAWVDEKDLQLARVEAELVDDLSFGLGFLVRLKKGSHAFMQRRKVNDEIWLPAQARFAGDGRLLLVKGIHIDALSEYFDYKKFTVETESAVTPEEEKR